MSMVYRGILVSMFVICMSFGLTIINEVNAQYETDTGRKFIDFEATPPFNFSDYQGISSKEEFNSSMGSVGDFNKPSDVGFDFDFFQSINVLRLLGNIIFYSVWGFPGFLINFGMPGFMELPMIILMNLNHMFVAVYLILNKFR